MPAARERRCCASAPQAPSFEVVLKIRGARCEDVIEPKGARCPPNRLPAVGRLSRLAFAPLKLGGTCQPAPNQPEHRSSLLAPHRRAGLFLCLAMRSGVGDTLIEPVDDRLKPVVAVSGDLTILINIYS